MNFRKCDLKPANVMFMKKCQRLATFGVWRCAISRDNSVRLAAVPQNEREHLRDDCIPMGEAQVVSLAGYRGLLRAAGGGKKRSGGKADHGPPSGRTTSRRERELDEESEGQEVPARICVVPGDVQRLPLDDTEL